MRKNEILSDVWRNRDAFARRHRYDLESMVVELRHRERRPLNTLVDRSKDMPNKRLLRTARDVGVKRRH